MTVALTALVVAAMGATGGAKVAAVADMRRRAEHLGFSVQAYRLIGSLELAGVAGLVAGLAVPALAVAAAVGLLLMMLGAVITHLRAGDRVKETLPAIVVGAVVTAQLVSTVVTL